MINMVSSLTNLTYVVKLMIELTELNQHLVKLILFVVYFTIIFFIVEPEKLKYMTMITTFLFMSIGESLLKELRLIVNSMVFLPGFPSQNVCCR